MYKVIYFKDDNCTKDYCQGQVYYDFIDYAFENADFFMLVFKNYGHGYSAKQRYFRDKLRKYKVKSRRDPFWPGTPGEYCDGTLYKIAFYRTDPEAIEILKEVDCLSAWGYGMPEDLCFFKQNKCWFYSVAHEYIGCIIDVTNSDLEFLRSHGLIDNEEQPFYPQNNYFEQFHETIVDS